MKSMILALSLVAAYVSPPFQAADETYPESELTFLWLSTDSIQIALTEKEAELMRERGAANGLLIACRDFKMGSGVK